MHRNRSIPPTLVYELPPELDRPGYGLVSASVLPFWMTGEVEHADLGFRFNGRLMTMEGPRTGILIQGPEGERIVRPDSVKPYSFQTPRRGPKRYADVREAGPFQFTPVRWPRNQDRGRMDHVAFIEPRGRRDVARYLGDSARGRPHRPWHMPRSVNDFEDALRYVEGWLCASMRSKESKRRSGHRRTGGVPLNEGDAAIFIQSVGGGRPYRDLVVAACAAADEKPRSDRPLPSRTG